MRKPLREVPVSPLLAEVTWVYICLGLVAALAAAWAFAAVVSIARHTARLRRIALSRTEESFSTFQSAFPDLPVPELSAVYSYLQRSLAYDGFPLRADDSLHALFGLAGTDLQDYVVDAVSCFGRDWPPAATVSGSIIMTTVGDVVRFLFMCPPMQPPAPEPGQSDTIQGE
jgi:hypothetical protein